MLFKLAAFPTFNAQLSWRVNGQVIANSSQLSSILAFTCASQLSIRIYGQVKLNFIATIYQFRSENYLHYAIY